MIALASSLLMMTAYERVNPKRAPGKADPVKLDVGTQGTLISVIKDIVRLQNAQKA